MFLASNIPVPNHQSRQNVSFIFYLYKSQENNYVQTVSINPVTHTHKIKLESKPKTSPSVTTVLVCYYTKNDPFPVIPNSFLPQPVINLAICSTEKTYTSVDCFFKSQQGSNWDKENKWLTTKSLSHLGGSSSARFIHLGQSSKIKLSIQSMLPLQLKRNKRPL